MHVGTVVVDLDGEVLDEDRSEGNGEWHIERRHQNTK